MTAMERIKEIEVNESPKGMKINHTPYEAFLLKAFRVMHQVAMHIQEDFRLAVIFNPEADKCRVDILKEFEDRMKESKE